MKKGFFTLLLLVLTATVALAAPSNTTGPWGIDSGGFKNLSTALSSPATSGKTVVITKPMATNNKTLPITRHIKIIRGGRVDPAVGKTFNFNGQKLEAGNYEIIGGLGSVSGLPEANPFWFGAVSGGVTDASAAINLALSSGATIVDCQNMLFKINSTVIVPAGVYLKNANFQAGTAGMNMVSVNTGSKVSGKLTGTGTTSIIERGIYPAADGVTDVELDVEVSALTVGVHAQYLTAYSSSNVPKRWKGKIFVHDIVGAAGTSEGYGLLLSPAESCKFDIKSHTIARHAVYLSAGAKHNVINADIDGCNNYAAQLYSTSVQEPTEYNHITINARNLGENVAGQGGAAAIIQKANFNTLVINHAGNNATSHSVLIEGSSGGPYPTLNKIIDGNISGQFTGAAVIKLLNQNSTTIANNSIAAYATNYIIGNLRTGTNGADHGGYIYDNTLDAQGQSIKGIYTEINSQPSYIGLNDIRNNGAALRVDDQTGGYRTGFSKRVVFAGTTASVPANTSVDATATFIPELQTTGRHTDVKLTGSSVQFFNAAHTIIGILDPASTTSALFRVYNGFGTAQTFDYEGVIEGD